MVRMEGVDDSFVPGDAAMVASPPRKRDGEIINAAIEVFSRRGYAASSIQDVADSVGLLKGSLYHYIDSKEELLFRILDESHRQASAMVEEVRELDLPPLERLRTYIERYVTWHLENVERVTIYFNEWRYLEGERKETIVEQARTYTGFLRGLISEAQAAGEAEPQVDHKLATAFIQGAINAIPHWYRKDGAEPAEAIAARYADMAVSVVTRSAAPERR